jgi:hypothetical protein
MSKPNKFHIYITIPPYKIGYTDDLKGRMNDYRTRNPEDDYLATREVTFDDNLFYKPEISTRLYIRNKVNGKTAMPDELIMEMLAIMDAAEPVIREKVKGSHNRSEVYKFSPGYDPLTTFNDLVNIATKNDWDYTRCRSDLMKGKPIAQLYVWQAWVNAQRNDARVVFPDEQILPEFLCARFGKTMEHLYDFTYSSKNVMVLLQYNLSPINSFLKESGRFSDFEKVEFFDLTSANAKVSDLPSCVESRKVILGISMCGKEDRKKYVEFLNWCRVTGITSLNAVVKLDEADWGSTTKTSKSKLEKLTQAIPNVSIDVFSGTGEAKIEDKMEGISERAMAVAPRISYTELLLLRDKKHYLFSKEYLRTIDPAKKPNEYDLLTNYKPEKYRSPDCLVNLNAVEIKVNPNILSKIERLVRDNDNDARIGLSYAKICKDPVRYSGVHQLIWRSFLGIGELEGSSLAHTRVTNGKRLNVIMGWVPTGGNGGFGKKELMELTTVLRNDKLIADSYDIVPVCGAIGKKVGMFTTNKQAEEFANRAIAKARDNKRGVIFLSMTIAQRSFSVPEIDAVVFYRDSLPSDSANQKLSRCLTPGKDYYGNLKKDGWVFNLSLTPNDSILEDYVNEEINNQSKGAVGIKQAAENVFGAINYFKMNEMEVVKVDRFTDKDCNNFARKSRKMSARSEIRDLALTFGYDIDQCKELLDLAMNLGDLNKKEKDILKKFVNKSRRDDGTRKYGAKPESGAPDDDEPKDDKGFQSAYRTLRTLLYDSILNLAAIYCWANNKKLHQVVDERVSYATILKFIEGNDTAIQLFQRHLNISTFELAKTIFGQLSKMSESIIERLESNLVHSIEAISFRNMEDIDDINNYLSTDTSHGKLHTPDELVHEMMSQLEQNADNLADRVCLDPHCKTGGYLRWLNRRGVKSIYGVEDDPIYVVIARHVSGVDNIAYIPNLVEDDDDYNSLNSEGVCEKISRAFGRTNMKFDVIVGNPPYQTKSDPSHTKTHTLWDKFVGKSLSLLKENGYLCYVHPSLWRQDNNELGKVMKSKQIDYLEVHDANDGMKTFGVTTRYDWYVMRNCASTTTTTMKCQDGEVIELNLSEWDFVPNGMFNLITSLLHVEGKTEKIEIVKDSSYHTQRTDVMAISKSNEFAHSCIYYIPKNDKPVMWWSRFSDKGHFGVPKVIFCSGVFESTGLIVDKKGEYGMTQFCGGIVDSVDNLDLIAKAMQTPKFIKLNHALVSSKTELNVKALRHFRKDFWKSFVDANGNELV